MNNLSDVAVFNFTGVYESEDFYKDIDNPRFIECGNIPGTDCLCDEDGEKEIRRRIDEAKVPLKGIHFIDNGNYHSETTSKSYSYADLTTASARFTPM